MNHSVFLLNWHVPFQVFANGIDGHFSEEGKRSSCRNLFQMLSQRYLAYNYSKNVVSQGVLRPFFTVEERLKILHSQSRVIEPPEGTGGIECVSLLLCSQIIQPVNVRAPLQFPRYRPLFGFQSPGNADDLCILRPAVNLALEGA